MPCRAISAFEKGMDSKMKKLVEQIMKFGAVGFLCFFIDYLVGLVVLHVVLGVGDWVGFRIHSFCYRELYT